MLCPDPDAPDRICTTEGDGVLALTQTQVEFTVNEPMIQMVLCPRILDAAQFRPSITTGATRKTTDSVTSFKYHASVFVHMP